MAGKGNNTSLRVRAIRLTTAVMRGATLLRDVLDNGGPGTIRVLKATSDGTTTRVVLEFRRNPRRHQPIGHPNGSPTTTQHGTSAEPKGDDLHYALRKKDDGKMTVEFVKISPSLASHLGGALLKLEEVRDVDAPGRGQRITCHYDPSLRPKEVKQAIRRCIAEVLPEAIPV